MSSEGFDEVNKLKHEERYEAFLALVLEDRDIWILVNSDGDVLRIYSDELGVEFLPVWPHSEFAEDYAANSEGALVAKSIALPEFFSRWVPGLKGDDVSVGVFPGPGSDIWMMEAEELKADLQDELSSSF
ncbi:DUF2750 domain-containing protein [Agaribacterium sp. ZY112]|uniref:DUF2750 domain-containing protein n=1 Tax=Agaribacterium sp. ZY112 TaxID=3233574 RepID=UPI0035244576